MMWSGKGPSHELIRHGGPALHSRSGVFICEEHSHLRLNFNMALSVNIKDIPTTGAGPGTSAQYKACELSGVLASHALAEEDAGRMKKFRKSIFKVAANEGVDPAIIAAIISRETRAGHVLQSNGWNEGRAAFGIMQVARMNNPQGGKESEEHITQAVGILKGFIKSMNKSWPPELQYKGGIAAYNCGPSAVTYPHLDQRTEGRDYANDVVARAQWYKEYFQRHTQPRYPSHRKEQCCRTAERETGTKSASAAERQSPCLEPENAFKVVLLWNTREFLRCLYLISL
ncbi:hypothetical protein AOLI_G00274540 [Acnodon oligacanthus]